MTRNIFRSQKLPINHYNKYSRHAVHSKKPYNYEEKDLELYEEEKSA
jgi:hypothetical protein